MGRIREIIFKIQHMNKQNFVGRNAYLYQYYVAIETDIYRFNVEIV